MLVFLLSFRVLFLPLLSFRVLFLPLLSFRVLLCLGLDYCMSLNSSFVSLGLFQDELSIFMSFMSCLVFFLGSFFMTRVSVLCNFCIGFMFFLRLVLFSTSNLFLLYVCYECSLIPIVIIILKWGSYPDRSFSCFMMLVFTSVFTLPFMYFLV